MADHSIAQRMGRPTATVVQRVSLLRRIADNIVHHDPGFVIEVESARVGEPMLAPALRIVLDDETAEWLAKGILAGAHRARSGGRAHCAECGSTVPRSAPTDCDGRHAAKPCPCRCHGGMR